MHYRVLGLPPDKFRDLFNLSDDLPGARSVKRIFADEPVCRGSNWTRW